MQRRFDEVDAAFAFEEGEGDCTLAFWRRAHRNYFGRQGTFAPDMLLYCERFRLVVRIDPEGVSRTCRRRQIYPFGLWGPRCVWSIFMRRKTGIGTI